MRTIMLLSLICALSTFNELFSQDASLVYNKTVNSTVTIITDNGSQGSGFFVAPNIIATNYHVVEGATNASCYLNSSATEYKIDGYVGIDKSVDLILLKVSTLNKPAIKLALTTASIGQKVFVLGSPRGLPATISDGIISGMRDFDGTKLLQMTASLSPGSSGGPVLNSIGELIGVSVSQLTDGQNLNFAIPKSYLQILLDFKSATPKDLSTIKDTTETNTEKNKDSLYTEKEALDFLQKYSNEWGCEKYAKGTTEIRLQFNIENGKLIIWEFFPSFHPCEYGKIEIILSEIEMIEFEGDADCYPIYLKYSRSGLSSVLSKIRATQELHEMSELQIYEMNAKFGYDFEGIKLKKDPNQKERADRLIKAITFLAESYGAKIKKSGF
jgi:hypothetical protein